MALNYPAKPTLAKSVTRLPSQPVMTSNARHFEAIRTVPLPRAAVWHVLSHTDRLNRHIGLAAVQYGELNHDSSGLFRLASARVGGVSLKWREYPFQWEQDGRYSVVRLYDQGPINRFEGGIELEDDGLDSTKVIVFSDMEGRGTIGRAIVPLIAKQFINKTLEFCDKYLTGEDLNPPPRGPAPRGGFVNERLLGRLISELKKHPITDSYADDLSLYLREAGDGEVAALRPFEWAHEAGLEGGEALRTCLHAVKAGLLNMRWSMMCPNCRVSKNESATLSGVENKIHCDLCGIDYDLNFDRYVELKFAVHPAVRRANPDIYCLSGPFATPHILVQKAIKPGEKARIIIPFTDETLRLRVLRANKSIEIAPGSDPRCHLVYDGLEWTAIGVTNAFTVENTSKATIFVALEKLNWDPFAVTAARVTSMQEFRDLFASEVLHPNRQMSIENVTLFFSDLSNSTALYESIGDAPAFGRVGSHFDFLTQHIGRNGGAVVKTMGDAVMAVFHSPDDAVRAALEIQTRFHEFSSSISSASGVGLNLKIGLHHGPALVVNSNDRLDYFGRTVNVAARVAGASVGGDFVMTGEVWEFSSVQRLLIEAYADLSRFETELRGVEHAFALVRVRPQKQ